MLISLRLNNPLGEIACPSILLFFFMERCCLFLIDVLVSHNSCFVPESSIVLSYGGLSRRYRINLVVYFYSHFIELLVLFVHQVCNILTQNDLVFSEAFREKLLNLDCWLVIECVNQKFVNRFDESKVTFCIQIELFLSNKVRDRRGKSKQAVVDER